MEIELIALHERLGNLADNWAAHPEYDGAVIRSMARMPIVRYLGGYDIFCDLQVITGTREDLSYQATAREIADRVGRNELTPEELTDVVNILAAPVARIDEAYYRKDSGLLPRCEPERNTQVRVSLVTRLEGLHTLAGPPYNLHRMPIRRFFQGVFKLTGDRRFVSVYWDCILPHVPENRDLFREAVYEICHSESPQRTDMLYKILVEPFAALPS
jgi:hypothetical protein